MIYVECHRGDVGKRNVYEFRGTHANELNLLRVIHRRIRYLMLNQRFCPEYFSAYIQYEYNPTYQRKNDKVRG